MTKEWDSPSVAELRKRFATYSPKASELSMKLANQARLVQSSLSGYHNLPVGHVLLQVRDVRDTLEAIAAELGKISSDE